MWFRGVGIDLGSNFDQIWSQFSIKLDSEIASRFGEPLGGKLDQIVETVAPAQVGREVI